MRVWKERKERPPSRVAMKDKLLTPKQAQRWESLVLSTARLGHVPTTGELGRLWLVPLNAVENPLTAFAVRGMIEFPVGAPTRIVGGDRST